MQGISVKKIVEMAVMQDALNRKINENWKTAGYDYLFAAMAEAMEASEHYGWKWWKHYERNAAVIGATKMELIDIWHFLLSECIIRDIPLEQSIDLTTIDGSNEDFIKLSKKFIGMCGNDVIPLQVFFKMMDAIGMTFEELYKVYIAKNVLNVFRQDNGYKDGTYIKNWKASGTEMEDNDFVTMLLDKMDWQADGFPQKLMERLGYQYTRELAARASS